MTEIEDIKKRMDRIEETLKKMNGKQTNFEETIEIVLNTIRSNQGIGMNAMHIKTYENG